MDQTLVQALLLAAGIGGKRLGASAWGGNGLGADIAGSVGSFAMQYALGALMPRQKTTSTGTRLADLQQTFSTYGVTIPIVFGDAVVGGNYIWTPEQALLEETVIDVTKTGKGISGVENTATLYKYYLRAAIGICEGVVRGVKRIWVNDQLVLDQGKWLPTGATTAYQLYDEAPDDGVYIGPGIKLYFGTETQLPCPYIESFEGAGRVSAHRGLAYIVLENFPLEKFGNGSSVLNFKFEISRYVAFEDPITSDLGNYDTDSKLVYSDYDQETGTFVMRSVTGVPDLTPYVSNSGLIGWPPVYSTESLILQMPDGSGGYRKVVVSTADVDLDVPIFPPNSAAYLSGDRGVYSPILVSNGFIFLAYANPDYYSCWKIVDSGAVLVSARLPDKTVGPLMAVGNGLPLNFRKDLAYPPHTPLGEDPTAFVSYQGMVQKLSADGYPRIIDELNATNMVGPTLDTDITGPVFPENVSYEPGVGWVPSGNWYLHHEPDGGSEHSIYVFSPTGQKINTFSINRSAMDSGYTYPLPRVSSWYSGYFPRLVVIDPARKVVIGPGWVTQLWDM